MNQGEISSLLARARGEQVVSIDELRGGANSGVALVATGAACYVVKQYRPALTGDHRDRLRTEFEALRFLRDKGISQVPEPCCRDAALRLGVYQYIRGRKLTPGGITDRHLAMVAAFLGKLYALRHEPEAGGQPVASEACLRLGTHVAIVKNRLERLRALPERDQLTTRLHAYLEEVVAPFFHRARELSAARIAGTGLDPEAELPREKQILSPSDLGFQNIIVTGEDKLVFIDFEYFGWDDPAKLIADFYLQPAVPLPSELRRPFFDKLGFVQKNDPEVVQRLPFAYLFSALKWSLLVLNCFCAGGGKAPGVDEVRREKLILSNRILQNLEEELAGKKFPVDGL